MSSLTGAIIACIIVVIVCIIAVLNQPKDEYNADKLFQNLGYQKVRDDKYVLEYQKIQNCGDSVISFLYVSQEFTKKFLGEYGYIDMQELKAINMKCQELGWSDN